MSGKKTKILIAAGGTGGHIFPAQALAKQLAARDEVQEILFAGHGLSHNRYFQQEQFIYQDVNSSTVFSTKWVSAIWKIGKGILESLKILKGFNPDIVIGFGSFHSFPVLAAAFMKRTPIVLFESNCEPGKVNRLFSKCAEVSAVQFPEASRRLSGKTVEIEMPLWKKDFYEDVDVEQARVYYGLDPSKLTFLIFGGSQGAVSINQTFCNTAARSDFPVEKFQVIHIAGSRTDLEEIRQIYRNLNIAACVKEFEDNMHCAWKAASLAICRSGAATFAELVFFEVPAILIPYPHAADDHQQKNAKFMQVHVGGAVVISESELNEKTLSGAIQYLLDPEKNQLFAMKERIKEFKNRNEKQDLCSLVCEISTRIKK